MPARAILGLETALERLAGAPVTLERPSRSEHGDYATNVALQLGPQNGRPPRELAEQLAARATELDVVERAEVAGPGFLNLFLTPAWYGEALGEILDAGEGYGGGFAETPERVQVEMVSANPTGPLTVGSARNGAYGDAVARLLEFAGNTVEREYYFNDAGRQIELFRESVEARRRGEEPPEKGYTGEYVSAIAEEAGDPVERMLDEIKHELDAFRIHFDSWVLQREIETEIPEVTARGGHLRGGGDRLGPDERAWGRQGPTARSLGRR